MNSAAASKPGTRTMETKETTPHSIKQWLESLPHISNVQPVFVHIGRATYPAAFYTSTTPIAPGCRAYDEGKRESVRTML
jgi:hypothetical protein